MPGIPRDVAEHSLDIRAGVRPVKQPLRRFDEEKRRAIGEEIHKLMAVGFIKEVFHPEWLANPVLVKKKGGKWRMCVDYTGLNKACPKVPYPLPRIDQIVDSTVGCETLSFLDAYSGYHQIRMKESDQLATSFITPFGMYCYITMPFGLRNAGVTYQRCMNSQLAHRHRARGSAPRRSWRLAACHRPSHEELPLSRPKDGGLLRRGLAPGRQVLRARAQPHRSTVQRDCG
jgi:hypothetical protein